MQLGEVQGHGVLHGPLTTPLSRRSIRWQTDTTEGWQFCKPLPSLPPNRRGSWVEIFIIVATGTEDNGDGDSGVIIFRRGPDGTAVEGHK
ncbi:hypothetical protein DPEC_G00045000 [Dallia pectoralis]|uniref:Uncharacterized protein n=1 Tax=Dallia pectoralis TaxID=75939 RepID=A0ACC2H9I7_DALPE|nr:hypothetical protein DPEC_G00045000 [Dallia pectoralis]